MKCAVLLSITRLAVGYLDISRPAHVSCVYEINVKSCLLWLSGGPSEKGTYVRILTRSRFAAEASSKERGSLELLRVNTSHVAQKMNFEERDLLGNSPQQRSKNPDKWDDGGE